MGRPKKNPAKDSPKKEKKPSNYQSHMASWESEEEKAAKRKKRGCKIPAKFLKFQKTKEGDSNHGN